LPFIDGDGLRIKITLSVDWFGTFKGRYSGWHSSGAIMARIDNLLASLITLDRRCAGIHLVGLIPGPKESSNSELEPYLKLVTDELAKLFVDGVRIRTSRYPEGESLDRLLQTVKEEHGTDVNAERIVVKQWGITLRKRKGG